MDNFNIIVNILRSIFETLNNYGLKIYDAENTDFYVSDITYDPEADQLIVHFKDGSKEK